MTELIGSVTISVVISMLLRRPIFNLALKKGLFENINGRSSHTRKVPNIGGVIIYAAFITAVMLFADLPPVEGRYLIYAVSVIFFVGLYDDIMVISPFKKLYVEIAAALILIAGGIFFTSIHGILYIYEIPWWAGAPLTVLAFVGVVNAINFVDGIDGLCSLLTIITLSALALWFYKNGFLGYSVVASALVASMIPFLYDNLISHNRKIFLGDNGSLLIGAVLVILVIKYCELNLNENSWFSIKTAPALSLAFLAIPVMDALRVIVIRITHKKSPFSPDKRHLHHQILNIVGGNHLMSTLLIVALQMLFIAVAISWRHLTNGRLISIMVIMFITMSIVIFLLNKRADKKMATQKAVAKK